MTDFQKENLFLQNIRPEGVRRESLAVSVPRSVELTADLGDDLIETEDGIFPAGVNVTQARFRGGFRGGARGVRRGGPKTRTVKGGPRRGRAERVHEAMIKHQGYGFGRMAGESAVLAPIAAGIWSTGGVAATISQVTGYFGMFTSATINLALIGSLALIPGAGGAAYWLLKKFIKSVPGRLFAAAFPNGAKRIQDSIAAGWLLADKLAYRATQMGAKDKFWSFNHLGGAVLSVPGYIYMAYRGINTFVGGLLDCFPAFDFKHGLPKMANGAGMLVDIFDGRPDHYQALIKDDENDINETNWFLKINNWISSYFIDINADPHELDRDDNEETVHSQPAKKPAHA